MVLKNRSKLKKWSESIIKGFSKRGANQSGDLLTLDLWPSAHYQIVPEENPNRAKGKDSFH